MPLPQIVTPEYITTLPSTGQSVSYRPFLVKEEKILLMAQEGKDAFLKHLNKIELPIADIKVTGLGKKDNIIIIDEKTGLGVELKYPNLALIDKMDIEKRSNTEIFKLITNCVYTVFDKDQVYTDFTDQELETFVGDLPQDFLKKFMDFFKNMPKVHHKLTYTCEKCKQEVTHELSGLMDFFL